MKRFPLWLGIMAALILQWGAARTHIYRVDFLLIPVLYASLKRSCIQGMLAGGAAGLLEDALSGGLFGLHAFSKTLLGYLVHGTGKYLMVEKAGVRAAIFFVGMCFESWTVLMLNALLLSRGSLVWGSLLERAALSTLIGMAVFLAWERLDKAFAQRRRRP